jgi:hypothetical protein
MSLLYFPSQASASGSGKILQVVTSFKNDAASVTGTTEADTGLSCSITPSNSSNKIFCLANLGFGQTANATAYFFLKRDTTAVGVGTGGTDAVTIADYPYSDNTVYFQNASIAFLDSPSSTSALTYKITYRALASGQTINLNTRNYTTGTYTWVSGSSLTVFEIDGT